jgi:hypothetical protein
LFFTERYEQNKIALSICDRNYSCNAPFPTLWRETVSGSNMSCASSRV